MASANVELVRKSLDAWNRGDVEGWLHGSHSDVEWTSEIAQAIEGSQTVYRGREGLRRFWDEWRGVWTLTIEVSEFRERDTTVVALARVRARGQASGISFDRPIAYVFEFEDDLVRRARAYFDVERGLEAAGMAESMSQQNVDRLRAALAAFGSGETDVEFLAADFELRQASSIVDSAGVFRGRDAIGASLAELRESFDELSFEADKFIEAPSGEVVVLVHARGRGRGSGVDIDNHIAWVWTFRGDKAVRLVVYEEQAEALEAAGLRK